MLKDFLQIVSETVWGIPTVVIIALTGFYFTCKLKLLQVTCIKDMQKAVKKTAFSGDKGKLWSVATSLCATIGTGSISGVATALTLGGAGAIFWMWVSAFLGMAVAYAEGVLSIKYKGEKSGGIMYALKNGANSPKIAAVYAFLTVGTAFGMGSMVQTNSASQSLGSQFGVPSWLVGGAVAFAVAACLFLKDNFTGKLCAVLLPMLSVLYLAVAIWIITANYEYILPSFRQIFKEALGLKPIFGGVVGIGVKKAVSVGFKRGVFSNEAGLGTTAAIHAESGCTPHEQGVLNMFEVIIDTFAVCTLTALAILCSGTLGSGLDGAELVCLAGATAFGKSAGKIIAVSIAGFALATALGWSKIGLSAFNYLFKEKRQTAYKLLFILSAFAGAVLSLETVWQISDIFNGLMVLPCIAALLVLRKEISDVFYSRPVEPKPLSPRSVSGRSSDSKTFAKMAGTTTSCAKRSPGSKV